MDDLLSHDFGNIIHGDEHDDSSDDDDQREEEDRHREIDGLLDDHFNEISSIGEEEDDSGDDEDERSLSLTRKKQISSTPLIKSPPKVKRMSSQFSAIPEETLTNEDGDHNLKSGSYSESPEEMRRQESGMDGDHDDDYHVRLLLDQNTHLSCETEKLKHHLSVISGDYEGLNYKYKKLEEESKVKDQEIIDQAGKIAALESQVKIERDAKSEIVKKFSIAESTIQCLQNQLAELSRSDVLARLNDHHDQVIRKMKEDNENEMFALREKIQELEMMIEEKDHQVQDLEKKLNSQKRDLNRRSLSSSKLPRLELSPNNGAVSFSSSCELRETIQNLKSELDQVLKSNQELKSQIETNHKLVNDLKNTNHDLNLHLKDKDQQLEKLREEFKSSKSDLEQKLSSTELELEKRTFQIGQLEATLTSTMQELEKMSKVKSSPRRGQRSFSQSQVEQMIEQATEEWRKSTEPKYQELFVEQVKKMESKFESSKSELISRTRNSVLEELSRDIDTLCGWMKTLAARMDKPELEDLNSVLKPVHDIWLAIDAAWEENKQSLVAKKQEAEDARIQLEQAYNTSFNEPQGQVQGQSDLKVSNEELRSQIEELKLELEILGSKLLKYKNMAKKLKEDRDCEINKLKEQFKVLLKQKVDKYHEREKLLKQKLASHNDQLFHDINRAFIEGLQQIKRQADRVLEQNQKRSLDQLQTTVKQYHQIVTDNFRSNSFIAT